jgi:NTE family protein
VPYLLSGEEDLMDPVSMNTWSKRAFSRRRALGAIGGGVVAALDVRRASAQGAPAKTPRRRALVLGGGSIRGAYQAGVIRTLLNKGFKPDYLYGISVGSLNAAFLADRASFLGTTKSDYLTAIGESQLPGPAVLNQNDFVTWEFIGDELLSFWLDKITSPSTLIKHTDKVGNVFNVLTNNFDGLVSTGPLRELVAKTLKRERLVASPIPAAIGAVNIDTAALVFAQKDDVYFREFIMASTAIPIAMPIVTIPDGPNKGRYCDGSVKTILPIRYAADSGPADRLISIACQPTSQTYEPLKNPKNIIQLLQRASDIAADDVINHDFEYADKTPKKIVLIRPGQPISLEIHNPNLEITEFSQADIRAMIELGRLSAEAKIKSGELDDGFLD